jgi:hypothetical protein
MIQISQLFSRFVEDCFCRRGFGTTIVLMYLWSAAAPGAHSANAQTSAKADWRAQSVSSLHKITATAPGVLEKYPSTQIKLRAARGEWENFQIVVTAGNRALKNVSLSAATLKFGKQTIAPQNIQIYRENYVHIPKPSGNRVLRKLWWPDALIPQSLQPKFSIDAKRSAVFWVSVKSPANAATGEYSSHISVAANGQTKRVPFSLRVENLQMPAPTMRANVAVYYDVLRDWYQKNIGPQTDEKWAAQKKRFYDFLLDYRLNAYDLPVAWSSPEAQTYLHDNRVLGVRIPPLDSADFPVAINAITTANAQHKAYYYWIDEPPPARYAEIVDTTKKLREIAPFVKHCVTAHPNKSLKNAVDIWCPNIGDVFGMGHLDVQRLAQERKAGRETWWYTMVEPKFPYPTWLVDDDAASVRVYGWLMARFGITGFVYSMAHGWGPKPLENITSFAETSGDGTLLYPSEIVGGTGPMPSIRLMLLRDAIEDYELLRVASEFKNTLIFGSLHNISVKGADPHFAESIPVHTAFLQDQIEQNHQTLLQPELTSSFGSASFVDIEVKGQKLLATIPLLHPNVDGKISTGEVDWTVDSTSFESSDGKPLPKSETKCFISHDNKNLYVAMRCRTDRVLDKEWTAVEIAPQNAQERWRFVLTQKGNRVLEKHTREGHFRTEGVSWTAAQQRFNGFYDVEFQIPLSVVGNAKTFRFNALRRTAHETGTRVILRAFPDIGDVYLMPLVTLG